MTDLTELQSRLRASDNNFVWSFAALLDPAPSDEELVRRYGEDRPVLDWIEELLVAYGFGFLDAMDDKQGDRVTAAEVRRVKRGIDEVRKVTRLATEGGEVVTLR